ncbi:MAG: hypothetical protein IJI92_04320 [Erysipelotrichaceae bacterium]|nr:hypothetical protein [Erysipelotrichaceae bacterium]
MSVICFHLFSFVVDDLHMFISDQCRIVLFGPGHTAVEHCLQKKTRDLDEILQSLIGELNLIIHPISCKADR